MPQRRPTPAAKARQAARTTVAQWARSAQAKLGLPQAEVAALLGEAPNWFTGCIKPSETGCLTREQAKELGRLAKVPCPPNVLLACDAFANAYASVGDRRRRALAPKAAARLEARHQLARWARTAMRQARMTRAEVAQRWQLEPAAVSSLVAPSARNCFTPAELTRFAQIVGATPPQRILALCHRLHRKTPISEVAARILHAKQPAPIAEHVVALIDASTRVTRRHRVVLAALATEHLGLAGEPVAIQELATRHRRPPPDVNRALRRTFTRIGTQTPPEALDVLAARVGQAVSAPPPVRNATLGAITLTTLARFFELIGRPLSTPALAR